MAFFITRIELHSGTDSDYQALHSKMEQRGFSRVVTVNGKRWWLPTAEYYHDDNTATTALLSKAKGVVISIGKTASIIVNHDSDWAFDGLRPA